LTKQRIKILRQQLQAAETILNANEQSLDELKSHKRALDSRITKLQNMKKVQQQLLQKILLTPNLLTKPNPLTSTSLNNISSKPQQPLLPSANPPLPPTLPPAPRTSLPQSSSLTAVAQAMPKKITTLGEEIAATASLDPSFKSKIKANSSSSALSSLRPNLNVSKSTDMKLEELAKNPFLNNFSENSSNNKSLIVNAKVVNVSKNPTKTHRSPRKLDKTAENKDVSEANKAELAKMKKLNSFLEGITVI
jgi:hypothetical protein